VFPDRHDGWSFLLLRGDAIGASEFDVAAGENGAVHLLDQLGRGAAVRFLASKLATYIDPYAEFAVHKLSRTAPDLNDLYSKLADEIPDEGARAQFLAEIYPEQRLALRPGLVLTPRRNAAGYWCQIRV
jgi:hypothetical protein